MGSAARLLAVLTLFTRERPVWQPDAINEALGYSRPTGYRYVKSLVEAGLLRKVAAGHYALGGRIIELDHQLRHTDPVLLAAMPVMAALGPECGFDIVLSVLYAGPKVIDIHRVNVQAGLRLAYGRGRPRPLFLGAAPKVLLAGLPRAQLLRVHATHAAEIALAGLGTDWAAFRSYLAGVRRQGFYRSHGELEPAIGSLAVPVIDTEGACVAALAAVGEAARIAQVDGPPLKARLSIAAEQIRQGLNSA